MPTPEIRRKAMIDAGTSTGAGVGAGTGAGISTGVGTGTSAGTGASASVSVAADASGFGYLRGLGLSAEIIETFAKYRELLLSWNAKVNLTAITEPREVEIKHFLDSLLLDPVPLWRARFEARGAGEGIANEGGVGEGIAGENIAKAGNTETGIAGMKTGPRVADVGSGAGFPGIPLKIVRGNMSLVIIEATAKRVAFLNALLEELALSGIDIARIRAEEAGHNQSFRESFDWALARGVASMPVLLEYCLPLLKKGGYLAAYKGPSGRAEARTGQVAASSLGGKLLEIIETSLPEGYGERQILIYEKIKPTPAKYPRGPGIPSKQPLR